MSQALLSSESNEWYTPPDIIEQVRSLMGDIYLDPASNATAQQWIQAKTWYSIAEDGFNKPWYGRLWLNPPYGIKGKSNHGASEWILKAIAHYEAGEVTQAVLLVRGDSEGICRLNEHYAICEPFKRIAFIRQDGTPSDRPVPGCKLYYLGTKVDQFYECFQGFGAIRAPFEWCKFLLGVAA